MGWHGLMVAAVPVSFKAAYCKNLETLWNCQKSLSASGHFDTWGAPQMAKTILWIIRRKWKFCGTGSWQISSSLLPSWNSASLTSPSSSGLKHMAADLVRVSCHETPNSFTYKIWRMRNPIPALRFYPWASLCSIMLDILVTARYCLGKVVVCL